MEVGSDIVGLKLKEHTTEITWRQTTNYAAAIADCNPAYLDDSRAGGLIAPPGIAAAVTWQVMGRLTWFAALPYPEEILHRLVHYTEHLQFFRPVRPGDRLAVLGEIAAVIPHRAGTQLVVRFLARDREEQPVFTEHMGCLLRGVGCTDEGKGSCSLPYVPPYKDGEEFLWESQIPVGRETSFIYDGCADIHNPIHTSVSFARSVGLPDLILHGSATLALAVREIVNREAGGDSTRLKTVFARFSGMVIPPDTIRVRLTQKKFNTENHELRFVALNSRGEKAVSAGYALLGCQNTEQNGGEEK